MNATTPVRTLVQRLPARQLRYLVVGGLAALVEFGSFLGLRALDVPLTVANVTSFLAGLIVSFAGNRRWSFGGDHVHDARLQFAAYLVLAVVNATLTSLIIGVLVRAGVPEPVAKVGCMALVATWNFFIFDRVIFRRR